MEETYVMDLKTLHVSNASLQTAARRIVATRFKMETIFPNGLPEKGGGETNGIAPRLSVRCCKFNIEYLRRSFPDAKLELARMKRK
jgi:hypothetical protein